MPKQKNPNGMGCYDKLKDGRVRWRQMVDGKTRTITAKSMPELKEKVKKVADLPIIKNKIKVSEWFEKWLEIYIKPLKKQATYYQYKILYEQHIFPIIGNRLITSVKQYDIQQIIAKMNEKGLSTWTMKHVRKILHIAFDRAFKDKLIPENPVVDIEIPKKQAKPRKTITASELKILFENLKNSRWYWAFRFMLVTGLRRGELLALRWSDIDYENKRIIVDESNSASGLGDTKNSKVHYVPLSERAIYYLAKQKEMLQHEFNPILYNPELQKLDLIFPSENGTLMKSDSLNSVLDRINRKTGLHITPHMFRHTFVYMSKGHMTLSELQEALGHDESTTTLDIYGTMLSDTEKVANKIDEAFAVLDEEINKIETKHQAKIINLSERKKAK
ncbi:MAG: site-specific integrase [Thermoanaerobacteraceae bacterium]|nr:site-specific integrase [Thermoanaerobacteraceae bacterium]